MEKIIHFAKKFERLVQFLGAVGILFSVGIFITTIQRNSEADTAMAWQLLNQDKAGNFGRAHALNTLASSQCLLRRTNDDELNSFQFGMNKKLSQCILDGWPLLNGPQSLFGIDVSSPDSGVNLIDNLFMSSVKIRNNNFNRVHFKTSSITNSDIIDSNFGAIVAAKARFIGNKYSNVDMSCSYIVQSTFHDNVFYKLNLNSSRIVFSSINFYKFAEENKKSAILDLSNSLILDSNINLSNTHNVKLHNVSAIMSNILLHNVSYVSIQKSDFSESTISGNLSGNISPVFVETNMSGTDLTNLIGLDPGDLDRSFYCNNNRPKLPSYYKGNGSTQRQCIPNIPENVTNTLQELKKYWPQFMGISPLKVFYMSLDNDEAARKLCQDKSTAIERTSSGTGVLLFDKGKIALFTNMATNNPIPSGIIEIGKERGAETKEKQIR